MQPASHRDSHTHFCASLKMHMFTRAFYPPLHVSAHRTQPCFAHVLNLDQPGRGYRVCWISGYRRDELEVNRVVVGVPRPYTYAPALWLHEYGVTRNTIVTTWTSAPFQLS